MDAFGVEVARLDDQAAAGGADAGVGAVVANDGNLAETAGGADGNGIVHLQQHPLQAFVEVDAIAGRVEGGSVDIAGGIILDDGARWNPPACPHHRRRRQGVVGIDDGYGWVDEFGRRKIARRRPARIELRYRPRHHDFIADLDPRRAAGEDEDALRSCRVGVGLAIRGLHPEAARGDGGDDAMDIGHGGAVQG